jgi:hypothetical protein
MGSYVSGSIAVPTWVQREAGYGAAEAGGCHRHTRAIVIDIALAHAVGDKVEAAYRRGDLFPKCRQLMDAWADYCAHPAPACAGVVAMRRGQ